MEEGVVEEYLKSVEWRVKGWMVEEVTHPVEEVIQGCIFSQRKS